MNTNRIPKLILVVSLILAAFFAYPLYKNAISAPATNSASSRVGFGDLQRYDSQLSTIPNTGSLQPRVGFGDLQLYDSQISAVPTTASPAKRVGFGDLHRFESQP